jgi:hypothetical protein
MIKGIDERMEPLRHEMNRFRKKHGDTYLDDPRFQKMEKSFAILKNQKLGLEKFVDTALDRVLDKIKAPDIPVPEKMFQSAMERLARETADNTATTAENTDPNKLRDQIPFMLDASITSLSDALLAISRRAVEEPDPNQEAMIMALGSIDDNTANMGGLGFTGRR